MLWIVKDTLHDNSGSRHTVWKFTLTKGHLIFTASYTSNLLFNMIKKKTQLCYVKYECLNSLLFKWLASKILVTFITHQIIFTNKKYGLC